MKSRFKLHFTEGEKFYVAQDYANALKEFEQACEVVFGKEGSWLKAIAMIGPKAKAWWYAAQCLRALPGANENLSKAIDYYSKSLSLSPSRDAYVSRASAYCDAGNFDLSISDCTTSIQIMPDDYAAYYYRSVAYEKTGQYKLAIADAEQAHKLNPGYAPNWLSELRAKYSEFTVANGAAVISVTEDHQTSGADKSYNVTYQSPTNENISCRVTTVNASEGLQRVINNQSCGANFNVVLSQDVIRDELQYHQSLPDENRYNAAIASAAMKSIGDVGAAIKSPETRIANVSFKSDRSIAEMRTGILNSNVAVYDKSGNVFSRNTKASNNQWQMSMHARTPDVHVNSLDPVIDSMKAVALVGAHLPPAAEGTIIAKEFFERMEKSPTDSSMTEKIVCGGLGAGMQVVAAAGAMAVLRLGIGAGVAAAPETGGASLMAIPIGLYAMQYVGKVSNMIGDNVQHACHEAFSVIPAASVPAQSASPAYAPVVSPVQAAPALMSTPTANIPSTTARITKAFANREHQQNLANERRQTQMMMRANAQERHAQYLAKQKGISVEQQKAEMQQRKMQQAEIDALCKNHGLSSKHYLKQFNKGKINCEQAKTMVNAAHDRVVEQREKYSAYYGGYNGGAFYTPGRGGSVSTEGGPVMSSGGPVTTGDSSGWGYDSWGRMK